MVRMVRQRARPVRSAWSTRRWSDYLRGQTGRVSARKCKITAVCALKVHDAKLGRYGWIVMARVVAGHEDGALAHLQAAEPMALRSAAGKPRHEKAQGGTDRASARWNAGALTL
jgi:hypothetical protein